jgi:hypothetical protein
VTQGPRPPTLRNVDSVGLGNLSEGIRGVEVAPRVGLFGLVEAPGVGFGEEVDGKFC